jgi:hypothetical protein
VASRAASSQPPHQDAANFRILDILDSCRAPGRPDDVVVCGRRTDPNRYRLPLPSRNRPLGAGNVRGEAPRATAEENAAAPCGIFQGQRLCGEDEMAEFGYGQGRDPITFLGTVVTRLIDPEPQS